MAGLHPFLLEAAAIPLSALPISEQEAAELCSRGFEFASLDLTGLPTPLSGIYGTQPDIAAVDHIEILRRPSGLFGGPGEPAGTINMRLSAVYASYTEIFQPQTVTDASDNLLEPGTGQQVELGYKAELCGPA